MLDRQMAAPCSSDIGAVRRTKKVSLSCLPKIIASLKVSFSRMKFLMEGTPANPLKSSLQLWSWASQLGSLVLIMQSFLRQWWFHLVWMGFWFFLSMTVKSVDLLSQLVMYASKARGLLVSWQQLMQASCFLQFSMTLVSTHSSPLSQSQNSLPEKVVSILPRQLTCSQEMQTQLVEKTYLEKPCFSQDMMNLLFSWKQNLQVALMKPFSVRFTTRLIWQSACSCVYRNYRKLDTLIRLFRLSSSISIRCCRLTCAPFKFNPDGLNSTDSLDTSSSLSDSSIASWATGLTISLLLLLFFMNSTRTSSIFCSMSGLPAPERRLSIVISLYLRCFLASSKKVVLGLSI